MDVFSFEDYKSALREIMKERQRQFGSRFTFEKMANACGIQKTYLSRVLNSTAHLSADQLFTACEFLKLNPEEIDFLILLREHENSQNPKRLGILKNQILNIRKKFLRTESVLTGKTVDAQTQTQWEYYTDVDIQLSHIFLTIPAYVKQPELIGKKLGLSGDRIQEILLKLKSWNLIEFKEDACIVREFSQHLPEDSPIFTPYGILNRMKSIEKMRANDDKSKSDYFFSVTFSASEETRLKFKKKILDLIKSFQSEVINSPSQEVYQFNLDLFRWS